MDKILGFLAASFPQLIVLLLVLVSAFVVLREWRLMRSELTNEVHLRVQAEIGSLTGDIVKKSEEARNQLSVLAKAQSDVRIERDAFDKEMSTARAEIDRTLNEVRARSSEMAKLAPTKRELDWVPPRILVQMARKAQSWSDVSGYLSRIDHDNAMSKDLEIAGDLCRDYQFFAKAIEFYREAAAKDTENVSAKAELLALLAEFQAAERSDALKQLQDLVINSSSNIDDGGNVQKRYFNALMELGRYREMADFCEAQLKQTVTQVYQTHLHRNLAAAYRYLGRIDEALTQCQAALKLSAGDANILRLYAHLLVSRERYQEASEAAIRCIRSEPTEARNYLLLASIQEKQGETEAARLSLASSLAFADASERVQAEDAARKLDALEEFDKLLPFAREKSSAKSA